MEPSAVSDTEKLRKTNKSRKLNINDKRNTENAYKHVRHKMIKLIDVYEAKKPRLVQTHQTV